MLERLPDEAHGLHLDTTGWKTAENPEQHGREPLGLSVFDFVQEIAQSAEQVLETAVIHDELMSLLIGRQAAQSKAGVLGATVVHVLLDHGAKRLDELFHVSQLQDGQTTVLVVAYPSDGERTVHTTSGVITSQ